MHDHFHQLFHQFVNQQEYVFIQINADIYSGYADGIIEPFIQLKDGNGNFILVKMADITSIRYFKSDNSQIVIGS